MLGSIKVLVDTVSKEHFISLYKPARDKAISKRNILAGWAATSLLPFNPERNLIRWCPQDQSLQTPVTPVTPVTTEALTSLHILINQELSDPSKRRLQRHVQKLASAAKISFAKQTLLQDQNQFLSKINNEVKVCQSTRSGVLGKAKVMSYEDLEEARAKRAAKDEATAAKGKGKRGRPRKNPAPETEAEAEAGAGAGVEVEAVSLEEVDSLALKNKVARLSEVELARPLFPWRAPVARMY
ncbi:hypothetical protein K505DRAFT_404045 [Melanomma pulvis-pyrius CBS 109.77]|uniref:Uncharacterized protein n=1 Tax=Melanomma pulvis-pyrius CBS 109.77 TaxID=1314802 RepID=A0A6A6XV04_9PLEO|nr:hypothetical protein K505DRAFT_404045 [Melanomma pulvis-pyrius CBS 109.77]